MTFTDYDHFGHERTQSRPLVQRFAFSAGWLMCSAGLLLTIVWATGSSTLGIGIGAGQACGCALLSETVAKAVNGGRADEAVRSVNALRIALAVMAFATLVVAGLSRGALIWFVAAAFAGMLATFLAAGALADRRIAYLAGSVEPVPAVVYFGTRPLTAFITDQDTIGSTEASCLTWHDGKVWLDDDAEDDEDQLVWYRRVPGSGEHGRLAEHLGLIWTAP